MKNNIQLIKEKIFKREGRPSAYNEYQPYYFLKDGKKYFIRNLPVDPINNKANKQEREKLFEILLELRKNNFSFYTNHCACFSNPLTFLDYVIEEGFTFRSNNLINEDNLYNDFSGNLNECSHAFRFRIYDKTLLSEIKKKLKTIKISS